MLYFNGSLVEVRARRPRPAAERAGDTAANSHKGASDEIIMRFLIVDAPVPSTLGPYIKELGRHRVRHLVRVCSQTYRSDVVEMAHIKTHAWPFEDGAPPPQHVVDQWLSLIDSEVANAGADGQCSTIAVHCVAGLGRAPILVAVALVEYGDFAPMDAVGYIRERRRGAINQVQLNWLMAYRPRHSARKGFSLGQCCVVS